MNVGKRIKDRRKTLGLSAEQLAEIINVSPATVYRYESSHIGNMGIDKLTPIANALHTTEAYLMGLTDTVNSPVDYAFISDDELHFLTEYRKLNPAKRAVVDALLKTYADELKEEK